MFDHGSQRQEQYHPRLFQVMNNVQNVIIGKQNVIELALTAILARGHILLEDRPGVGKTMLVRALARSLGCTFNRIQFTPDLLPSDVTGVSIFNPKTLHFEFRPGPIFGHIILADEINRTSPKTQSALLEAMEEESITVDGTTHRLPEPFVVMATQNPIEYEGTFPLPEAQLDRFMLKLHMGYPQAEEEVEMLSRIQQGHPISKIGEAISLEELIQHQHKVRQVYVHRAIKRYIVDLVRATREHHLVELGVSPRGSIALLQAALALAYIRGREYVLPDDVKYLAPFTLSHRIILTPDARLDGVQADDVVRQVLAETPVPGVDVSGTHTV